MQTSPLQFQTRRHFFRNCGVGLGKLGLASLLYGKRPLDHPARAKSVIFLFMAGGPSQFELFDYKPTLQEYDQKPAPDSLLRGKRFAFMDTFSKEVPKMLGTRRKFQRAGQSGAWVSECLPHTATVVDDLTFLHAVSTENFNHAPAKVYVNTGSTRFGRPSMGAWVTYGIGSESKALPGFVVLQSGPRGPRGGAVNWSSGFLPTSYQGVPFRSAGDPILDLSTPKSVTPESQLSVIETVRDLNRIKLAETGDPEIETRIASYETAYRMQTSGPELIDFSQETPQTLAMYGVTPGAASFANNCLLARRLVERGVRFVQLYHTDWDHHADLSKPFDDVCKEIDQPTAALIKDLKGRGLLDQTLVIWGGEFGRTPMGEVRDSGKVGRNHHIDAYTMWMTGGGVKPGVSHGATDDFGFSATEGRVDVHDVQATMLHLLGIDHTKLTFRFQGRDFRLTDVAGEVIRPILA